MLRYQHISVAIPMMAEWENVPSLVERFRQQTIREFTLYLCVNQPEDDLESFKDNQLTLNYLNQVTDLDIRVIDRSSPGLGWSGKQKGVGWARKLLFAKILEDSNPDELVVSLDADTHFSTSYLESLLSRFNSHPHWSALAVPYYHPLSGSVDIDRAMLRYECYMRHYLISLLEIHNPYAFTALGSAMVFPLWAYKRVGGITPLQGGEDFYLLQKFAKTGVLGLTHSECVYPQGRISHRVPFGTGPAISKGVDSMDISYPFFPQQAFDEVGETFHSMPTLFSCDIETPMSTFLREQLKCDDLWGPLRQNFKTESLFVHAAQEKVDGLRILQYLKRRLAQCEQTSGEILADFCRRRNITLSSNFSFAASPIAELQQLREALFQLEMTLRARISI